MATQPRGKHVNWQIPSGLYNISTIHHFSVNSNQLQGKIPSNIGLTLPNLMYLGFADNNLTGFLPTSLSNASFLQVINFNKNWFTGPMPKNLGRIPGLDFSYNNLSGLIPREIVSLSISIYLDLSNNNLLGSIPSEAGSLTNLGGLDFSNNRLSGLVPSTISSCIGLQQLYLGGNSFHGEIPQGLSLLKGPVPVQGVFRNVSAVSLEENTELCGGISKLKLPPCPPTNLKKKNSHILLEIIIPVSVSGAIFIAIIAFSYIFIQRKTKSRNDLHDSPFESQFPRLSYTDLLRATDGFSEANMIGSGRFGSVYKGIINNGNTTVAVKVLNLHVQGAHKSFTRECNVLRGVRHRNLLKILSISVSIDHQGNDFTALIYQFKKNGSVDI
ncbi:UNVERIFIED_CONTAM: putative receptor-like protein kinase [Sesamum latifolium]|uniref:Receptor-like protein kinase n=1 Tax=Sesamum latifolium TaxID=2727402 RepID=A0AAW2WD68_9LAMI